MDSSDLEPDKQHNNILHIIIHGIANFLMIISIITSVLRIKTSSFNDALFFVILAHIIYGIHKILYWEYSLRWIERIKKFAFWMLPTIAAISITAIINLVFDNSNTQTMTILSTKISTVILVFLLVIPIFTTNKNNEVALAIFYSFQKLSVIRKILFLLYRILVVTGFILTFTINTYFATVTIVGCIIWGILEAIFLYCWWNDDLDYVPNDNEPYDKSTQLSATNNDGEYGLSKGELYRKAKRIADSWTDREEYPVTVDGHIRYSVDVEVNNNEITCYSVIFTINAKMYDVKTEHIQSAYYSYKSIMSSAAYSIEFDAIQKLGKYKFELPIEIKVQVGNLI